MHRECMMHVVAGQVNDDERVREGEGGMKKNWKVIGGSEGTA